MKPELTMPQINPENQSVREGASVDRTPVMPSPEINDENTVESFKNQIEIGAILDTVNLTTTIPTPVANNVTIVKNTTIDDNPAIAKDDDLIEKEWVDRAKKIIDETQDNPFQREKAVSELQVDYLKKRYGKELGPAE